MKEIAFLGKNKKKWETFEQALADGKSPLNLTDLYIELTDDLAYARTFYPNSSVTAYLNSLASKAYLLIYKNKKEKSSRFVTFWRHELPLTMNECRRPMLYSLIIFLVTTLIGVLSVSQDSDFPRLILGDGYVNMTIANIESGDPMGVYGHSDELTMFLHITYNNIIVSFRVFVFGLFTSIVSAIALSYNGIMVGCFLAFMAKYGVPWDQLIVIMLHGTLELSAIVIAGGAGIVLGNGILFPGTYTRLHSFRKGATRGMKIVVGLVPVFIVAGFIESFITRYAFMPQALKLLIVGVSFIFVLYYFVIYPFLLAKKINDHAKS
ncbi:MAG: stage II sporulation protein M [Prolixibacteraceae bacterium]|nr:stage II sporulation protein M [Prolixibacteraceae bacterium]